MIKSSRINSAIVILHTYFDENYCKHFVSPAHFIILFHIYHKRLSSNSIETSLNQTNSPDISQVKYSGSSHYNYFHKKNN